MMVSGSGMLWLGDKMGCLWQCFYLQYEAWIIRTLRAPNRVQGFTAVCEGHLGDVIRSRARLLSAFAVSSTLWLAAGRSLTLSLAKRMAVAMMVKRDCFYHI